MSRKLVAVAALGAFALLLFGLGSSANACIFGWGNSNGWGHGTSHRNHCYKPRRSSCHAPAPTCCKPAPACHGAAKPPKKVEEAPAPPPEEAPKAAPKKKAPAPPAPKKAAPKKPAPKKPAAKKKEA